MKRRGFFATALCGFVAALFSRRSDSLAWAYTNDHNPTDPPEPSMWLDEEGIRAWERYTNQGALEYDTGDQWPRYHVNVPASREVWKR